MLRPLASLPCLTIICLSARITTFNHWRHSFSRKSLHLAGSSLPRNITPVPSPTVSWGKCLKTAVTCYLGYYYLYFYISALVLVFAIHPIIFFLRIPFSTDDNGLCEVCRSGGNRVKIWASPHSVLNVGHCTGPIAIGQLVTRVCYV